MGHKKIKDISKAQPEVDLAKVAKVLGVDKISGQKQTEGGKNYFTFSYTSKNGRGTKKWIYELKEEDLNNHALLGIADGQEFFHCLYIAIRHVENFRKRVCCYRIEPSKQKGCALAVSFYELKQGKK